MPMADTASIHTSTRTGLAVQERAASTKLAARETPCRRTKSLLKRTQVNHHQTLRPTPASCLSQPNMHPADAPCRRAPTSDYVTGPSPKQSPCAHQVRHSPGAPSRIHCPTQPAVVTAAVDTTRAAIPQTHAHSHS